MAALTSQMALSLWTGQRWWFISSSLTFEGIPDLLVAVSAQDGAIVSETKLNLPFPLSGIHLDEADGTIVGFGLEEDSMGGWHYVAGRFDVTTDPATFKQQARVENDIEPFVDFAWSEYDSAARVLYVLSRHEDDPIAMPAELFSFNLNTNMLSVSAVNISLNYIYSSFFVDSRTPSTLMAFSPGPVDSSGNVNNPVWQLVKINAITGSVVSVAKAPTTANQYPVWWGGGVSGFTNSGKGVTPENIALHYISPRGPGYPHPSELIGLSADLRTNTLTVLANLPYLYNMVLVGQ